MNTSQERRPRIRSWHATRTDRQPLVRRSAWGWWTKRFTASSRISPGTFGGRFMAGDTTGSRPSFQSLTASGYSGDKRVRLAQARKAYDLADFKNEGQYSAPTIRKEFKDTAFWQPAAVTGPDGKATVSVSLPDNLTTWRATAKAVTSDTKVGSSLAKVISRKNLILRLETPRFLTKGDTVTISGIVHNYTNADKTIKVRLDVDGVSAKLLDQNAQTITLAKQGEQRIDWRVNAGQVGDAKLLAVAQANDLESDGVELPLPVVP